MEDTLSAGRIDIIIFPNGGKEIIGRMPAYPPVPEMLYMPEVRKFVADHQSLPKPTRFTGYYTVKDGALSMTWSNYAGEIVQNGEERKAEVEAATTTEEVGAV